MTMKSAVRGWQIGLSTRQEYTLQTVLSHSISTLGSYSMNLTRTGHRSTLILLIQLVDSERRFQNVHPEGKVFHEHIYISMHVSINSADVNLYINRYIIHPSTCKYTYVYGLIYCERLFLHVSSWFVYRVTTIISMGIIV